MPNCQTFKLMKCNTGLSPQEAGGGGGGNFAYDRVRIDAQHRFLIKPLNSKGINYGMAQLVYFDL